MVVAGRIFGAAFAVACSAGVWIVAQNYRSLRRPDVANSEGIVYGLCFLVMAGLIPVAILGRMSGWSRSISFAVMALAVVVDMGLYLLARGSELETKVQAVVLCGSGMVTSAVLALAISPRFGSPRNPGC